MRTSAAHVLIPSRSYLILIRLERQHRHRLASQHRSRGVAQPGTVAHELLYCAGGAWSASRLSEPEGSSFQRDCSGIGRLMQESL